MCFNKDDNTSPQIPFPATHRSETQEEILITANRCESRGKIKLTIYKFSFQHERRQETRVFTYLFILNPKSGAWDPFLGLLGNRGIRKRLITSWSHLSEIKPEGSNFSQTSDITKI